jgi:hypothetical protein
MICYVSMLLNSFLIIGCILSYVVFYEVGDTILKIGYELCVLLPMHPCIILLNHHPYHMNRCTYNCFIVTINSFQNNNHMNKILCSNCYKTDTIHHTPPDISINTVTSARPNQFHSALHTRQSSI